jgi:hypothetical protein
VSRPQVADPVERDATVALEPGARLVLAYPVSGAIYELHGPGRFVVRGDAVQASTGSGRVAKRDMVSVLRALRIRPEGTTLQASAAMRGASTLELQAEGPTGSQPAQEPMRLCWRPLGAQWLYRVRLIDDDGIVLFEAHTRASTLELPAALPLQANAPYVWHVQASGPNGRSAEAVGQFRRLDATGRALVGIARRQYGFAENGTPRCPAAQSGPQLTVSNPAASR